MWDDVNIVGLRNNYLCAIYGSRLMVAQKKGLIVNVSSAGATIYMFNPAYGIGKTGVDRMTADCALELKKHNVAFVGLSPGVVKSDTLLALTKVAEDRGENIEDFRKLTKNAESTSYVGKCVTALATDPKIMEKSGKVLSTLEVAEKHGISNETDQCQDMHEANDINILLNFVQGLVN